MTFLRNNGFLHRLIALSKAISGYKAIKRATTVTASRGSGKRLRVKYLAALVAFYLPASFTPPAYAEEQSSEYRLKAAFLYNFAAYTTWPNPPGHAFTLCIYGDNPFGKNLQHLQGKKINEHDIFIKNTRNMMNLSDCHIVFITQSVIKEIDAIVKQLQGMPILTIADSPGVGRRGVVLNMAIKESKVIFEANIVMAKRNGLTLSSQLLRFASEVYQE